MPADHAPAPLRPRRARRAWTLGAALALVVALAVSYLIRPALDRYIPRDDTLYRQIDAGLSTEQSTATDYATLARQSSAVVVARVSDVRHLETVQSEQTIDHYGLVISPTRVLFGSTSAADEHLVVDVARANDDPTATLASWKAALPKQPAIWFLSLETGESGQRQYHLVAAEGLVVQGLQGVRTPLVSAHPTALARHAGTYSRASALAAEIDALP